uniref:Uncharacterized protein n=1 Tax=Nelumbo nucifera TaxID=4432 RepID=A0A822ZWN7_NELNU|nr:TPA_asm: hypothetical protein HUJ06_017888 [Nelumbo nucifera]
MGGCNFSSTNISNSIEKMGKTIDISRKHHPYCVGEKKRETEKPPFRVKMIFLVKPWSTSLSKEKMDNRKDEWKNIFFKIFIPKSSKKFFFLYFGCRTFQKKL